MNYSGVFILTFCLLVVSCKTNKVTSPEAFEGSRLILSHGGGFTGKYTIYCLLENGQLFKNSKGFEATEPVSGLDRKVTSQIFSNYEILGLGNIEMIAYNNLNYSITMIDSKRVEHKLNWGKGQEGAEKLQLFYNNIMSHIKRVKEKGQQMQQVR